MAAKKPAAREKKTPPKDDKFKGKKAPPFGSEEKAPAKKSGA